MTFRPYVEETKLTSKWFLLQLKKLKHKLLKVLLATMKEETKNEAVWDPKSNQSNSQQNYSNYIMHSQVENEWRANTHTKCRKSKRRRIKKWIQGGCKAIRNSNPRKTERGREEQSFLDVSDCVQWRLKHPCWRRQSGPSFGSLLGHHSSEMWQKGCLHLWSAWLTPFYEQLTKPIKILVFSFRSEPNKSSLCLNWE